MKTMGQIYTAVAIRTLSLLWVVSLCLVVAHGCAAPPKPDNDIVAERLSSIDNHLSDIHADLKRIADRPHVFPLIGGEKDAK